MNRAAPPIPGPRDPREARGFRDLAPESVLLGGAGAAILLQLADPRVGRGVAVHSDFVQDPLRRLWATLDYVYAVALGGPRVRAAQVAHVAAAHRPVHGEEHGEHPAYSAEDPDAQLWVAMTLAWAGNRAWEAVLGPLPVPVQDRVMRGYGALAFSLGVPESLWFATRSDFDAEFARRVGGLHITSDARAVAGELLAARHAPAWLRALMPTARLATVALLPASVRAGFGLKLSPAADAVWRTAVRALGAVYPRLPQGIRQAPAWWRLGKAHRALAG